MISATQEIQALFKKLREPWNAADPALDNIDKAEEKLLTIAADREELQEALRIKSKNMTQLSRATSALMDSNIAFKTKLAQIKKTANRPDELIWIRMDKIKELVKDAE